MDGLSLERALEKTGVKKYQLARYRRDNPLFENEYMRARELRADFQADEIVHIADTEPDAQVARNRIDARKWVASKMLPQQYGDRLDLNVNQTIDIGAALAEARARALPPSYPTNIQDAEIVETLQLPTPQPTGLQSVASDNPSKTKDAKENESIDIFS